MLSFASDNSNAIANSLESLSMPLSDNALEESIPSKTPISEADNERVSDYHSTMQSELLDLLNQQLRLRSGVDQIAKNEQESDFVDHNKIPASYERVRPLELPASYERVRPLVRAASPLEDINTNAFRFDKVAVGSVIPSSVIREFLHLTEELGESLHDDWSTELREAHGEDVFSFTRSSDVSSEAEPYTMWTETNKTKDDSKILRTTTAEIGINEEEEYIYTKQGLRITPFIFGCSNDPNKEVELSRLFRRLDQEYAARRSPRIPSYSPVYAQPEEGFEQFESSQSSQQLSRSLGDDDGNIFLDMLINQP